MGGAASPVACGRQLQDVQAKKADPASRVDPRPGRMEERGGHF